MVNEVALISGISGVGVWGRGQVERASALRYSGRQPGARNKFLTLIVGIRAQSAELVRCK